MLLHRFLFLLSRKSRIFTAPFGSSKTKVKIPISVYFTLLSGEISPAKNVYMFYRFASNLRERGKIDDVRTFSLSTTSALI